MAFNATNCVPRLITVEDAQGCTLTRADIRAFTTADFEEQGLKEVGMDRIIAQTKEARMTGVPERVLMDLILSKMVGLKTSKLPGNDSVIAPFSLVPKRQHVNINYFLVTAGAATPDAGSNGIPASAWDLTVTVTASPWATDLPALQRYFLPGRYILVEGVGASGERLSLVYKVIRSVNADSGGINKAKITVEPNYSSAGWAALSAGDKAVYNPTTGSLQTMGNSVSDFESWAQQEGATNDMGINVFWEQTIRETAEYNDEFMRALKAPLTSDFFKKFRSLDIVQDRKRREMLAERAFYNTVFYGQRINENQTEATYRSLPQVEDLGSSGCILEYKANTIGWHTQLVDCGKVSDRAGAALNLDTIFETLYNLKRFREADSGTINVIDGFTDRFTASHIQNVMIKYYKAKYGLETTRFYQANQKIMFNNQPILNYNLYEIPDQSVGFAVFTDSYFDDRLSAAVQTTAGKSRARQINMMDWSDLVLGVKRTATRSSQTNVADNLYNKTIKQNVTHYQLRSKTIEARLGDANRHAVIENFSDECPAVTVASCELSAP